MKMICMFNICMFNFPCPFTLSYFITGRPARVRVAQPCRYCFYSVVQKWGFRPAGATRCPDKREIWLRSAPPCQISCLSRQKCGNTAPKTVKMLNFGHKFAPQRSLVCPIFTKYSDFVRVCRWILSFYFGCFRDTNK